MYFFTNCDMSDDEAVYIFTPKLTGSITCELGSNCEYEIWNKNKYIATVGRRSCANEAYLNKWTLTPGTYIRVHWLHPTKSNIWYRSVHKTPFLYSTEELLWTVHKEVSITFGEKFCSQLARQNLIKTRALIKYPFIKLNINYNLITDPVPVLVTEQINPIIIATGTIRGNPTGKRCNNDLVGYLNNPKDNLNYTTYDLGLLALHKITGGTGIYLYTQTANFKEERKHSNQKKVKMADWIVSTSSSEAPIGHRGCRYVHVFTLGTTLPQFMVYRSIYPFIWKDYSNKSAEDKLLLDACKNTIIACTDGGFVDTVWRERAQWTGDARMMAKAIKTMTNNYELIPFVLKQISNSYNSQIGMVQCAWPVKNSRQELYIPGYHMAFCLAVVENNVEELFPMVYESITVWKNKYLHENIISHLPGWLFTDWDFNDNMVTGRDVKGSNPNCVINCWWSQLCTMLNLPSLVNIEIFRNGNGYSLYPGHPINIHATACVIQSGLCPPSLISSSRITLSKLPWRNKVTAYFAYFVASSLTGIHRSRFIKAIYSPSAIAYGTLWEKHDGTASIAHSWSVGIAELLM